MTIEVEGPVAQLAGRDINNYFFGGWEALRNKSIEELRADLAYIELLLKDARRAFRRHLSILPFLAAIVVCLLPVIFGEWMHDFMRGIPTSAAIGLVLIQFGLVMGTLLWTTTARQPLLDGLILVKLYRKRIASIIALREVTRSAEKQVPSHND